MLERLQLNSILFAFAIFLGQFITAKELQTSKILTETWKPPEYGTQQFIGYYADTFKIPEGLENEVNFWIDIYSKYTTQQGVFHIAGSTDKILGEIDLTQVYANPKWGPVRKELEAEKVIQNQRRLIAKRHNISDIKKIRLQTGLKDRMLKAIQVSGKYLPMMEEIFKKEKIPIELTRVVFVESSFNINAGSKVGASGLWQIMPSLAKKLNYIDDAHDLRLHPEYSTRLAAKILKENYQITKSWPLAVTGYNHGVGSLIKIIRKYKSNDIAYLIRNVESRKSFGFASRNFYATFLAALYVESHANLYFPEPLLKEPPLQTKVARLKNKMTYDELLNSFDQDYEKLKKLNPQLKMSYIKKKKYVPVGTVISFPNKEKLASEESSTNNEGS